MNWIWMKSGLKCCPVRARVIIMLSIIIATGIVYWGRIQPRTPEDLFRVRCTSCHELRAQRLCEFAPELRPAIVEVMRHEYGADEIISQDEAELIEQYLRDVFQCR